MANNDFCPNCFEKFNDDTGICKKCGFNIYTYNQKESALPLYTLLNEQYIVGKVLGQGGFGITYKAYDTFKRQIVAIKEYMPADYSERRGNTVYPLTGNGKAERIFEHGKSSYIAEIKTLYQFDKTDGIVTIFSNFQENNTAYLVMEYLEGYSLRSFVKMNGGRLSPDKAGKIVNDVAHALQVVHNANILHRDISPENIFLINNGLNVKLIDFGAARHYIENSEEELSVLLKPGFAPPEQYSRTGNQGPWTDVYALAATLYFIVSGINAPDSISRMQNDTLKPLNIIVPTITPQMAKAVSKAMEIDCKSRTQNCSEFIKDLYSSGWISKNDNSNKEIFNGSGFGKINRVPKSLICKITCVSGDRKGNSIEFKPGNRVIVGKNINGVRYCDFEVSNKPFISKRHCVVEFKQNLNQFAVMDISTNGTYTNRGRRLRKFQNEYFPTGSIVFLSTEETIIKFDVYYG